MNSEEQPPSGQSGGKEDKLAAFDKGKATARQQRADAKAHAIFRELAGRGEIDYKKAYQVHTSVIKESRYAPELTKRHEDLNIAQRVVEEVVRTRGDAGQLLAFTSEVENYGGFLETDGYSERDMERRLEHPKWVIAHGEAAIYDQSITLQPSQVVADVQIVLPSDNKSTDLVSHVPLPSDPDAFLPYFTDRAKEIARQIHENHAIAACISDTGVFPPAYRGKSLVTAVRVEAVNHIQKEVNPKRKHPIKYLLANMFRVLSVTNGHETIYLQKPLVNVVSIYAHTLTKVHSTVLGWNCPPTDIPVVMPSGEEYIIKSEWQTAVLDISKSN